METNADIALARDRIRRLFRFLQAVEQIRTPVHRRLSEEEWTLDLGALPAHESVRRDTAVLTVGRPELTPCPRPPELIHEFLADGWDDPDSPVQVVSKSQPYTGGWTVVERFEDKPERVHALARWRDARSVWAKEERTAREALALYTRLFALWSRMQREGERFRILLGDGRLIWSRDDGLVDHLLVLAEVELRFDSDKPEFSLVEADADPELNHPLIQTFLELDGARLARCRELADSMPCHPLGEKDTDETLRAIVQTLSPRGGLMDRGSKHPASRDPRVYRHPVIFLAPRIGRYRECIEAFLDREGEIPPALMQVVGLARASSPPGKESGDMLFTLPTNEEQESIIRRLERTSSVQVQGPPGTGKTHTIANIIGHFLAQGKSILVTSHTGKALRVLREKVVPELRPLCISVLESTSQNQEELKEAVNAIVGQLSKGDDVALEKEAAALFKERTKLRKRLDQAESALKKARASEYEDVVVGKERIAPALAAKRIAEGRERDGWIPPPVSRGAAPPLGGEALAALYQTSVQVSAEDQASIDEGLPDPAMLLSPDAHADLIGRLAELSGVQPGDPALWAKTPARASLADLDSAKALVAEAVALVVDQPNWFSACAEAGLLGQEHRKAWDELIELAKSGDLEIAQHSRALADFEVKIEPDLEAEASIEAAEAILAHLARGGGLGFFGTIGKPASWKALLEHSSINGRPPQKEQDFQLLIAALKIGHTRERLRRRFGQLLSPEGAPPPDALGPAPEVHAREYVRRLEVALAWAEKEWAAAVGALEACGLAFSRLFERSPMEAPPFAGLKRIVRCASGELLSVLEERRRVVERSDLEAKERALLHVLGAHPRSQLAMRLVKAVEGRDAKAYRRWHQELLRLTDLLPILRDREALVAELEAAAPGWAAAIRRREPPHDKGAMPGDHGPAWKHRQWVEELDARAAASLDDLEREVTETKEALRQATARSVAKKAWAAQIRRTDLEQQQALRGWLNHIVRIGKGTGVRAEDLRREARRLQVRCRSAVPVWIMPLSRVIENYDAHTTRFDVVIIDEASQSDLLSLFVFAMGHEVVVVGDDEQVSPLAIGQSQEQIAVLIEQWLEGIPNRLLYDGRRSVYDIASESFAGGLIRLVEHFRCVPEIISFSNQLSYGGEIRPLREASETRPRPSVVAHRVEGGAADGSNVNAVEAMEVAALLAAATREPEYKGASMGVISLLGEEQAVEIDGWLQRLLPASEYSGRRIVCGTAANFQGDERDVMFLSTVSSPSKGQLRLMSDDAFKKRLNVAASRARDQMWIVHSIDPDSDLKDGDLRLRLIRHALDPSRQMIRTGSGPRPSGEGGLCPTRDPQDRREGEGRERTELERLVLGALEEGGYRTKTQVEVGAHVIDIVVVGSRGRAAIECDGDRPIAPGALEADMKRQAILERLGWRFVRVRASVFFRDPKGCMAAVFRRLEALDVHPEGPAQNPAAVPGGSDLVARVKARAAEIKERLR